MERQPIHVEKEPTRSHVGEMAYLELDIQVIAEW